MNKKQKEALKILKFRQEDKSYPIDFQFQKDRIVIKNRQSDSESSFILVFVLSVILPAVSAVYFIIYTDFGISLSALILGLVLAILFVMLRTVPGDQSLTVCLKDGLLILEPLYNHFQRSKVPTRIEFDKVGRFELVEDSLGPRNHWIRLVILDKRDNELGFVNFPRTMLQHELKSIITVLTGVMESYLESHPNRN